LTGQVGAAVYVRLLRFALSVYEGEWYYMGKIKKAIEAIVTICGVTMLLMSFLSILAQIVSRDLLKVSVPWTEEIARFSFIWMIFFGAIAAQARKEHINMDFILNTIPIKIRKVLFKVFDIASILFLVIIFIGAVNMLERTSRVPLSVVIPWLNTSFLYWPLVISMPLIIFYLILNVFTKTTIKPEGRFE
jgi:TRAP-type C4-dicarboxylate transport system permease small subunit